MSEPLSDDPFGSLIERIIEWMDEYYSIRLSGEVYRGMKENATPRSIPGTSAAWLQGCGAWQAAGDCAGRSKDCSDYIRKIHK